MRLDITREKGYFSIEDDFKENMKNMEDSDAEMSYRHNSNIFIIINIIYND